ncbi:ly6/PLAUR domain-containing protein 3-like [Colossoma macropomum]|uniref:ly6/PLAUR domain-containing protein 3-like n=1 Tax=Colossoma macropomum TaxID=42526 RepID=UPI001863B9DE|nr:ly6/PLAUR domain-containing protein 3-like [Colossoma macropomum]
MKLQVTLALISVLLPKALTLECYRCIPDVSGTCTDIQTVCADRCGSATALVSAAGIEQEVSAKDCAVAAECVNGSLNLGLMKMTVHMQCCTTDLCNTQVPAALPFGSLNGKKCYTCVNNDCTGTVSCEGDEDQCVSATATVSGVEVKVKGCASRSLCTADASSMQTAGVTGSVSCCEGNLCNSAEGVKLSLLIMLAHLISSILFI